MFQTEVDLDEYFPEDVPMSSPCSESSPNKRPRIFESTQNTEPASSVSSTSNSLDYRTQHRINKLKGSNASSSGKEKKKVVQRKFPGPAGLLPDIKDASNSSKYMEMMESFASEDVHIINENICSQNSAKVFYENPWQQMCKDFQSSIPDQCNVRWIIEKATRQQLVDQKVPFLAVVIHYIEINAGKSSTVVLTVKDQTGEIQAMMEYELYMQHSESLLLNSVIVLRNFAVLSIPYRVTNCLIITSNNLERIYCTQQCKNWRKSLQITMGRPLKDSNIPRQFPIAASQRKEVVRIPPSMQNLEEPQFLKKIQELRQEQTKLRLSEFKFKPHSVEDDALLVSNVKLQNNAQTATNRENFAPSNPQFCNESFASNACNSSISGSSINSESVQCSQILIKECDERHKTILEDMFQGVDGDSMFDDSF